jgi:hypothetical protein
MASGMLARLTPLGDVPQSSGVLGIEGVGSDAVPAVAVGARGDRVRFVAVLEVAPADPVQQRGGCGEDRGRGTLGDRLQLGGGPGLTAQSGKRLGVDVAARTSSAVER